MDLADGSLTASKVGNGLTDAQVLDTITASSYLPLAGGTLTGEIVLDELGIEGQETDSITLVRDVASEEHVKKAVAPVAERSASNSDRIGTAERDLSGVQQQLRDVERRLGSLEGKVDDIPEKVVRAIRGGTS